MFTMKKRDVHDEEVEEREERPDQDDGKRAPSPGIETGGLILSGREHRPVMLLSRRRQTYRPSSFADGRPISLSQALMKRTHKIVP